MKKDLQFLHTIALAHQASIMLKHLADQMQQGNGLRLKMLEAASKCNEVSKKFLQDQRERGISTENLEEVSAGIGAYLALCAKNGLAAGVIAELSKAVFDGKVDASTIEAVLNAAQNKANV